MSRRAVSGAEGGTTHLTLRAGRRPLCARKGRCRSQQLSRPTGPGVYRMPRLRFMSQRTSRESASSGPAALPVPPWNCSPRKREFESPVVVSCALRHSASVVSEVRGECSNSGG